MKFSRIWNSNAADERNDVQRDVEIITQRKQTNVGEQIYGRNSQAKRKKEREREREREREIEKKGKRAEGISS